MKGASTLNFRIFTSLTFRDFGEVHSFLVRKMLTSLRKHLKDLFTALVDVDLRSQNSMSQFVWELTR